MTRVEQVIWAAGFFDGDGCVNLTRYSSDVSRARLYRFTLTIGQTKREPLEIMKALWGGSINLLNRKNNVLSKLPFWQLVISSKQGEVALQEMLPYLIVKHAEALIALDFRALVTPGKRISEEEHMRRDNLAQMLKVLKRS